MNPLLERLDWFFSSNAWTTFLPNTLAFALSRDTSDHTPCVIKASTSIPRPQIFRFENYWLEHEKFPAILQQGWVDVQSHSDKAKIVTAKFKNLRKALKAWKSQLPNLAATIQNTKDTILLLDTIEEHRDLTLEEWNFRGILHLHLQTLLGYLQPSFSISFSISVIYRLLYKILSSISHFSPTTFSKSHSLYIKPYIRNVFCSKFLYVRIYHTSNAVDIFYFYLIQCLKRKEKIEKRRENLYI
jgi:hypothetical protein